MGAGGSTPASIVARPRVLSKTQTHSPDNHPESSGMDFSSIGFSLTGPISPTSPTSPTSQSETKTTRTSAENLDTAEKLEAKAKWEAKLQARKRIRPFVLIFSRGNKGSCLVTCAVKCAQKYATGKKDWTHVAIVISKRWVPSIQGTKDLDELFVWESTLSSGSRLAKLALGADNVTVGSLDIESQASSERKGQGKLQESKGDMKTDSKDAKGSKEGTCTLLGVQLRRLSEILKYDSPDTEIAMAELTSNPIDLVNASIDQYLQEERKLGASASARDNSMETETETETETKAPATAAASASEGRRRHEIYLREMGKIQAKLDKFHADYFQRLYQLNPCNLCTAVSPCACSVWCRDTVCTWNTCCFCFSWLFCCCYCSNCREPHEKRGVFCSEFVTLLLQELNVISCEIDAQLIFPVHLAHMDLWARVNGKNGERLHSGLVLI